MILLELFIENARSYYRYDYARNRLLYYYRRLRPLAISPLRPPHVEAPEVPIVLLDIVVVVVLLLLLIIIIMIILVTIVIVMYTCYRYGLSCIMNYYQM